MKTRLLLVLAAVAAWTANAYALDNIKTAKASLSGTITEVSPTEISIDRPAKGVEKVAVNEIEDIRFQGEPPQVNQVRLAVKRGAFADAKTQLKKIKADNIERDEIKAEIKFYSALVEAQLALNGEDKKAIQNAGKSMNEFLKDYPESYHFLQANETIGDLLVATQKYEDAEKFYNTVESKAPWPDFKMRAGVAKGRTLQAQGKNDDALKVFEKVLDQAKSDESPLVVRQRTLATLGKASCLAQTDKSEDGVKLLEELIAKADPEEAELHALAYNALGNCHEKAGRLKEARMAFLHTHILYPTVPQAHPEAVFHLAKLWKELGDPDRSQEMQKLLEERYADTKWAKKAAG